LEVVKAGLDSIRNTYNTLDIPVEAYIEAYRIYNEGHKDYIDTLYYSTAKTTDTPWLTIDKEFIEFLKQHNYKIEGIIYTPEDLKSIIR
ncbi:MAG: hypothetical protein QXY55_05975, partial [Candidatus Korarchaeota archaeon]